MSRFSFSTTCSSPTSTLFSSPTASPALPTSETLSPHSSLAAPPTDHCHLRRTPLSPDGLPRSPNPSIHWNRLNSPGNTPTISPSPPPRLPDSASTILQSNASYLPQAPSPGPEGNTRSFQMAVTAPHDDSKAMKDGNGLKRLGRSVGNGLKRCSSCFKRRPDNPDEVEEVPKPPHWSEL
ncbi:hypothetical protein GTA08_BOTSDO10387 [Botryosphaeria dothidea]|uniref:Uncharacterized protein n=1 Tax=Botryosphaeria dothidea TaxID=55169 RepID=A0A8H4IJ82_9PEZI|nr:hypothetical protein GTA08_BOTSDO10387 [Botryosphaeria dothidea]